MAQEIVEQPDYLTKSEYKAQQKARTASAWLNRSSGREVHTNGNIVEPWTVYIGETPGGHPTYEEPVMDMRRYLDNINYVSTQLKSGSIPDYGKVTEDPFIGEWKNISAEYGQKLNGSKRLKSAGVGTDSDFSAIDVINVMSEMVNTELRNFTLTQAVTTIGVPQLNINIDTYTRFTAETGVGEGVEPTVKRAGVSRTAFNLTKDMAHIAMTDESQMRLVHDMWQQQINTATTDFLRIKANKTATTLETATGISGANWGTVASGFNTNSPYTDLGSAMDTIFANNGQPSVVTSHDKVLRNYLSNTFIKGTFPSITNTGLAVAKVIPDVPGLANITWYTDNEHTNTLAVVLDKGAVALFQGPVKTEIYRHATAGLDGYLYRDWNLPAIIVGGRIRKLTGVS